jgi:hypothetical protein
VLLGKQVNGLSFKEGTHLLATASDDTTSMIWDAEKGISVTTLKVWPLLKLLVVNTLRLCLYIFSLASFQGKRPASMCLFLLPLYYWICDPVAVSGIYPLCEVLISV